ncbi:ABC transporter permease [Flaviflexus equikiangi]|uniref:ABC transporter permease n=1 Tax=Flaviflexus equikiangi TaxID=2758573 RepID=UPI0015F65EC9|nr:ABC transporter permease [Flaviflexus equikiangi]
MTALAQTRFETVTILRNGEQTTLNILLPVAALVALAKVPIGGSDPMPVGLAYASALALSWASTAFTSQAIAVAFDRRWGVLRMLATTPLGPRGLFAGKFGAVGLVALVQTIILTLVALPLGLSVSAAVILPGLAFLVLGLAAFLALALLIGGTLRPEAVLAVANLLWIVMAGLGGILVEASAYPDWWAALVRFTPPGALGEGLRALATGHSVAISLLVLGGWAVGVGLLAASRFRWDSK